MSNPPEPKAGEIWDIYLDPVVGREQGGRRPALVVSTNDFNDLENGLHVVAPITSRNRHLNLQVPITAPEGGLDRDSVIMCDQIKSVSILRFKGQKGTVSPATLERVRAIIARIIDR